MNLYIDINGVLLNKDHTPALYLEEFLVAATAKHDCYWLTTHCRAGENRAEIMLRRIIPEELWPYLDHFMPTDWYTLKTEGIDFTKDFLWFDDNFFEAEKEVLIKHGALDRLVKIDLVTNPYQLKEVIKML